jgi:ATP phosphoribosyltransferase regulatory subunit
MNGLGHKLLQVPPGVQCFVGEEARRRRRIEETVVSVFEGWSYEEIIPPLFDYADVFAGPALGPKTYSFVGRDGSLLALRPDFTSVIAKVAAARLAEWPAPLRLYYSGEVLRYEPPKAGRQNELYQMGLEHLGGDPRAADGEILCIAAECLEALGAPGWVLALGHVGVFSGLLAGTSLEPAVLERLRERVEAKDPAGVRDALAEARLGGEVAEGIARLTTLAGDASVLREAASGLAFSEGATAAIAELSRTVDTLAAAGLGAHLAVDLGEVRSLDYYTGLVFRVYARGLGFEVGGGGRYDTLLGRFGRPFPAVGFMLGLDRVDLLLEREGGSARPAGEAAAEAVGGADLAGALARARERRAQGARVRVEAGAP